MGVRAVERGCPGSGMLQDRNSVTSRLATGTRAEKCTVGRFRPCANIRATHTRLRVVQPPAPGRQARRRITAPRRHGAQVSARQNGAIGRHKMDQDA